MENHDRRDFLANLKNFNAFLQEKRKEKLIAKSKDDKFIRPPGALQEEDFLQKCTKCSDCYDACPYYVITSLYHIDPIKDETPIINPSIQPCKFCEGFPCIEACTTGALDMKNKDNPIAKADILIDGCFTWNGKECTLCQDECSYGALNLDKEGRMRVSLSKCTGCGDCALACPMGEEALQINPL